MWKLGDFNVKWGKKMMKKMALNLNSFMMGIKDGILLLRNFQYILFLNFSLDNGIFLDPTMKYYLSPHFTFLVLQTHCHHFKTCPLWVYYFWMWFSLNFIAIWIIKKLTMLMLNMTTHLKFIYNPKKKNCDGTNYPLIVCSPFV